MQVRHNNHEVKRIVLFGNPNQIVQFFKQLGISKGCLDVNGMITPVILNKTRYLLVDTRQAGQDVFQLANNFKGADAVICFSLDDSQNKYLPMLNKNKCKAVHFDFNAMNASDCLSNLNTEPVDLQLVRKANTTSKLLLLGMGDPGSIFCSVPKEVTHLIAGSYIECEFNKKVSSFEFFVSEENVKNLDSRPKNISLEESPSKDESSDDRENCLIM